MTVSSMFLRIGDLLINLQHVTHVTLDEIRWLKIDSAKGPEKVPVVVLYFSSAAGIEDDEMIFFHGDANRLRSYFSMFTSL